MKSNRASGGGFHRYNGDGYGDGAGDGRPGGPTGQGTGHLWPVLAGERAEFEIASGSPGSALVRLEAMRGGASGVGLIPEQDWEGPDLGASPFGTDPPAASIGFRNGGAAGSASPLTWSAAQYVRLMRDMGPGKVLERPAGVFAPSGTSPPRPASPTPTAPSNNT